MLTTRAADDKHAILRRRANANITVSVTGADITVATTTADTHNDRHANHRAAHAGDGVF